ncbi:MAG: hypothetical protein Q9190_007490 [Brigantiaea leucoxantha]
MVEDPPPKEEERREYFLVSDKLHLVPAPKAAEPAAPQPAEEKKPEPPPPAHATPQPSAQEPVNPWLAPNPTANPASGPAQHIYYTYMPRYSNVAAPPPQDPTPAPQPALPAPIYQPQLEIAVSSQPIPEPTKIWYGSTKAEVDKQNHVMAVKSGAYQPIQSMSTGPSSSQQFWCRELDGSYTLRTTTDIYTSCQPGNWYTAETGYPYFVRARVG